MSEDIMNRLTNFSSAQDALSTRILVADAATEIASLRIQVDIWRNSVRTLMGAGPEKKEAVDE